MGGVHFGAVGDAVGGLVGQFLLFHVGAQGQCRVRPVITNRIITILEAQGLDTVERIGIAGAGMGHRQGACLNRYRIIGKVPAEDRNVATAIPVEDVAALPADESVIASITGQGIVVGTAADKVVVIATD